MEYQKYDMGRYQLHVLKTDKFKTITMKINFKSEIKKEEVTIREVLLDMLLSSTKKYPTRRQFQLKKEALYNILSNGWSTLSGRYSIMSLSIRFLNPKFTEKTMINDSISFLKDMILSPNIDNDKFNEEIFSQQIENYKEYISTFDEISENYTMKRLDEIRGKGTPRAFHKIGYLSDLEKITPESLYEYYKKTLKEDIIDIFVIGDISPEDIKNKIKEEFLLTGTNPISKEHFITDTTIEDNPQVVIEEKNFEQSKLAINLKCEPLTEYEKKYVLSAYSYILGGGTDSLLFKDVREANSLCYFISSSPSLVYNTITILSGIDHKNYDITLKSIEKQLENIKKKNFDEEVIKQYQTIYLSSLKSIEESVDSCISIYENHEYMKSDLLEEKIEQIQKLKVEDVLTLAQKIHMDTIYFLKGVKKNEKSKN